MALYRAVFSIAGVNAVDAVLFNLKAASTDRAFLRRVYFGIEVAPTTAPIFGLKRMNAVGTGTITTASIFTNDPADPAAASSVETAWATTRPTVTGGSPGRGAIPLAVGNGYLFDFSDRPIVIPASAGLCGVNLVASGATVGTFGGYLEWED